jgi:hypothetical protein
VKELYIGAAAQEPPDYKIKKYHFRIERPAEDVDTAIIKRLYGLGDSPKYDAIFLAIGNGHYESAAKNVSKRKRVCIIGYKEKISEPLVTAVGNRNVIELAPRPTSPAEQHGSQNYRP